MRRSLADAFAKLSKMPKDLQDVAAERLLDFMDETSSVSERVSLDAAREAFANGDFVTLAKWKHDLGLADY
jgi:hypothetical protein